MTTRLKRIAGSSWLWRIKSDQLLLYNSRTHDLLILPWPDSYPILDIAHFKVINGGRHGETTGPVA